MAAMDAMAEHREDNTLADFEDGFSPDSGASKPPPEPRPHPPATSPRLRLQSPHAHDQERPQVSPALGHRAGRVLRRRRVDALGGSASLVPAPP